MNLVLILLLAVGGEPTDHSSGLYCGVYSMFAAIQAHGRSADLEDLLDTKYISSPFGSTLADLKRVADDHKLFSMPMRGMTPGMLRDSEQPVVLHVRAVERGSPFQHWLLYLGTEDGRARILDPPDGPKVVPFAEVMSRWDGVGMVISDKPLSSFRAKRTAWIEQAVLVSISAIVLIVGWGVASAKKRCIVDAARLFLLTGFVGVAYHLISPDGFLSNQNAIADVLTVHHASHLNELSLAEMKEKMHGAVIIDARLPESFASGSIPGAINVPISASASQRARAFAEIPHDAEVILYCQSDHCGWSDEMGSEMVFRGFENVRVYRGGYYEWNASRVK
ncbi:MAG: hypothetical protein HY288_15565 [Planctomycetia bacterium]|nr:hypothetical protein [Planctomycetia bacterium]